MSGTHTTGRPEVQQRQPTGREYNIAYGGAVLGALILGGFSLAFDWDRTTIMLAGLILIAAYVPFAVSFLFPRSGR